MSIRRVASLKPDPDERTRRLSVDDDVARLVLAFERDGIDLPPDVAYAAWQLYSGELCAGWLGLFEEDEALRRAVLPFLEIDEVRS